MKAWYSVADVIRWVHRTREWPLSEASDAEWLTEQLNRAFNKGRLYERQSSKLKDKPCTKTKK